MDFKEKIIKGIEETEKIIKELKEENNLDRVSFYEGYLEGLRFALHAHLI